MQIVIDIPDKYMKGKNVENGSLACEYILEAVYSGTPLPKGHGKIIDADYAIKQLLSLPKNELSTEDMWAMKILELAPTIIGADKEEEK